MRTPSIPDDSLRRMFETQEQQALAPWAVRATQSRGRAHPERDCFFRTAFQRDIDRIVHSESFRRLKHKTQVFLSPTNDHFRTRLTHTLEVVCTARCIARCLSLNEDLTEAIALGHDLGHTPFGHSGEEVLNELSDTGFHHAQHSVRVVTALEKHGKGLNLTAEVIDGIAHHSKGRNGAMTLSSTAAPDLSYEARVVRIADLVAYINHDIDDALRAGVILSDELPGDAVAILGDRHSVRIHTMVKDIIAQGLEQREICMSGPVLAATESFKKFLYEEVYPRPAIEIEVTKSKNLLRQMGEWFLSHPDDFLGRLKYSPPADQSLNRTLIDYLAGMTDGYAIRVFQEIFLPHFQIDSPLDKTRDRRS